MALRGKRSPTRIRLSDDRRAALLESLKDYYAGTFDDPLSDFRAEALPHKAGAGDESPAQGVCAL